MIHFHGMAGSGKITDHVQLATSRHVFVSFAHPRCLSLVAPVCNSFALDNGAFSAWKSGAEFDYDGFVEFVEIWGKHPAFNFCVIPDVIDGDEQANDEFLERWRGGNTHAAPVWHMHESLERLERLVETYSIVCLGSSGEYSQPNSKVWWERMEKAMDVATDEDGFPKAKLHGLRMLNPEVFTRLPLHSADSTNAERNSMFDQYFGRYTPPTKGQRAAVIANRVEAQQSASMWVKKPSQDEFEFIS
jgi:hypothetical protein